MGLLRKSALEKVLAAKEPEKQHTVLLVDDEKHNLVILAGLLSDQYNVLTAGSGEEGLALIRARKGPIHVIISDQRMPKMTGVEFLRETIQLIPQAKRILLTGYIDVEAVIDSINQGQIYKFILKPFEHHDMKTTIRLAIEAYELETQNVRLIEELRELNASLEQKVEERTLALREAVDKLIELNASKDRFFSVLAHELKNPLHAFILTAETIMDDIDSFNKGQLSRLAGNLYRGSQNLYRLLENLLFWARTQLQEGSFQPQLCSLRETADVSIELIEDLISQKQIQVHNQIDSELQVYVDRGMLEVVLRNLLSNATKFSEEGGRVFLAAMEREDVVEVIVQDQGVGIPAAQQSKLFRMEGKLTTHGTHGEKGTGLGLILCRDLLEQNGGKIWIESEVGQGTKVSFTLPKKLPATSAKETASNLTSQ